MMRNLGSPLAAAFAGALLLAPVLVAQQIQVFGGADDDRQASTAVLFGENLMAGVSINYSQPEWKAEYDAQFDALKGKNLRLGKNWWTSLDTSVTLDIAGTKVEPGAYFLGLHCGDDGAFSLMIFPAKKAMKNGMMPFAPEAWKGGSTAPLKLNKNGLADVARKMVIAFEVDQNTPENGKFSIRWGKHELTADVKLDLTGGGSDDGEG